MTAKVQAGDILLYREWDNTIKGEIAADAVKLGAILEEDSTKYIEYYHVAIALNDVIKIEADGKRVACHEIVYNGDEVFDIYRPQVSIDMQKEALGFIKGFQGQGYDWWLIADQGLRDLTGGAIHLPEQFIENKEVHEKICSTLAEVFLKREGFKIPPCPNKWYSPTDIGILLRGSKVA